MIKILDNFYCPIFEYLYLFVMVIYMAQMTPETGRMVGGLSGNPIPLLIPIVLTIILLLRNPVSFNHKRLWPLVGIMYLWSFAICSKFNDFSNSNESYYLFLIYAIFIAYIHVRVYGRDLFPIYEHIMVVFSVISLVLWGIHILLPFTDSFFHTFPATRSGGYNVLYLFHCKGASIDTVYGSLIRNSGCSWEPGRFAIMIIPALLVNLSRNGITFRNNKKAIILLLALASTMSTTGYAIAIVLYAIYWFEKLDFERSLGFAFIVLPIFAYLFSLDFMTVKIQQRANFEELTEERMEGFEYHEKNQRDEYVASLDRFESAYFEWMNFQKEPLLGYGRNNEHSWFYQEITLNFALTGGLVKILSQYGIFIGSLLYLILFFSSVKMSRAFSHPQSYALALALLLCSVSYVVFTIPIFTAFWLYGLFCYNNNELNSRILINRRPSLSTSYR